MSNPPIWALLRGLAGIVKYIIGGFGLGVKQKLLMAGKATLMQSPPGACP
jgi:hypothetical protein